MSAWLGDFHLLRPAWLWLLLPAALLLWRLSRRRGDGGSWERAVAPELLAALLVQGGGRRLPLARGIGWLGLGWLLAIVALAGPTWERLPQPLLQKRDALVVVLDLSLSMFATDLSPSRLHRARFKLQDLLADRTEGVTGLVVYSADAHVVAPLTDDTATLANMLPALAPDIMPQYGSNPIAGVERAIGLLQGAEATSGRILLVTDGIRDSDGERIADLLAGGQWQLSILAVGTAAGGPVQLGDALLRDRAGQIVVPRLETAPLRALAAATGGRFRELQLDSDDLRQLLPPAMSDADAWQESDQRFDQWRERGPLLVALLLPIAALATRRGWLLLLPLVLLPLSPPAAALEQRDQWQWRDLWQRRDQQGAALLRDGDPAAAAERFADPGWRGTAHYRAGNYAAAAEAFAAVDTPEGLYNLGNALAQAGELRQALAAYDAALARAPELEEAATNRERVLEALRRQHQQPEADDRQDQQGQSDESSNEGADSQGNNAGDQTGESPESSASDSPSDGSPSAGSSPPERSRQDQSDAGDQPGEPADESASSAAASGDEPPRDEGEAGRTENAAPGQTDGRDGRAAAQPDSSAEPADGDEQALVAGAEEESRPPGDAAVEQWLRRIPDDPAGLLRRKFDYESRQRAAQGQVADPEQPLW